MNNMGPRIVLVISVVHIVLIKGQECGFPTLDEVDVLSDIGGSSIFHHHFGVAMFDFNNDGLEDLFFTTGGGDLHGLFRNDGNFSFTDVTPESGITDDIQRSSALAADFDNDNYIDLLLGSSTQDGTNINDLSTCSTTGLKVFRNLGPPNFHFEDVTQTALGHTRGSPFTMGHASAADIDNDGDLDVLITSIGNFRCAVISPAQLLVNNGDFTFTDTANVGFPNEQLMMYSCVGVFHDFDKDGDEDAFVTTCGASDLFVQGSPFSLLRNNGDGTFSDASYDVPGFRPHVDAHFGFPMGVSFGDWNNDLELDLFVPDMGSMSSYYNDSDILSVILEDVGAANFDYLVDNFEFEAMLDRLAVNHLFYLRDRGSPPSYKDYAEQIGVAVGQIGFASTLSDLDNDGYLDLVFVGQFAPFWIGNPGAVYKSVECTDGPDCGIIRRVAELSQTLGLESARSTSMAVGDLNNDGFIDLAVSNAPSGPSLPPISDGQPIVFKNSGLDPACVDHHWIQIGLQGTISNSLGAGSEIVIHGSDFGSRVSQVFVGDKWFSTSSRYVHFGFVTQKTVVDWVQVKWRGPLNECEIFQSLQVDTKHLLIEGSGDPCPAAGCPFDSMVLKTYIPGYACDDATRYQTLLEAQVACCECAWCKGVTCDSNDVCTIRAGTQLNEILWSGEYSLRMSSNAANCANYGTEQTNTYIGGYACGHSNRYISFEEASEACCLCKECGGITFCSTFKRYTIRGTGAKHSYFGESSWVIG